MSLTNAAFGYLLNTAAARIHDATAAALAPLDLTPRESGVLHHVRTLGPISQRALGLVLRIDRSTMVTIIDALEGKGLVSRAIDPDDRRAHALTVTREGRQLSRRADLAVERVERQFLAPVSAAEAASLRAVLARLIEPTSTTTE
jgi:DNA-binding MarR family transcriptional regulator